MCFPSVHIWFTVFSFARHSPISSRYLVESVQAHGIDLRFGHSLIDLVQDEDSVTAFFENGQSIKGSFAVGCDGLHSRTRVALFGDEVVEYTGLTQVHTSSMPYISSEKLISLCA